MRLKGFLSLTALAALAFGGTLRRPSNRPRPRRPPRRPSFWWSSRSTNIRRRSLQRISAPLHRRASRGCCRAWCSPRAIRATPRPRPAPATRPSSLATARRTPGSSPTAGPTNASRAPTRPSIAPRIPKRPAQRRATTSSQPHPSQGADAGRVHEGGQSRPPKVISVAGKDRAALMMGGKTLDQLWWWGSNGFVSYKAHRTTPLVTRVNDGDRAPAEARICRRMELPEICKSHDYPVEVATRRFGRHGPLRPQGRRHAHLP